MTDVVVCDCEESDEDVQLQQLGLMCLCILIGNVGLIIFINIEDYASDTL
ncbi:MAG: hypothetical protein IJC76_01260 [Lachnospiraceae bacterium]|nr:hypothetical protein [Lachnospiraceae bacterium]